MDRRTARKVLASKVEAYWLDPGSGGGPDRALWGGVPRLPRETVWPVCGECSEPLSFLCQVQDESRWRRREFAVFVCPEHWAFEESGWEMLTFRRTGLEVNREEPEGAVRRVKVEVVLRRGVSFPSLGDVEIDEEDYIEYISKEGWNEEAEYGVKVGGYPMWIQGEEYPDEFERMGRKTFLMQIPSDKERWNVRWGDSGAVYIFWHERKKRWAVCIQEF